MNRQAVKVTETLNVQPQAATAGSLRHGESRPISSDHATAVSMAKSYVMQKHRKALELLAKV